jgi:hypothetical protein
VPAPTVVAGSRNAGDSPAAQDIVQLSNTLARAAAIGLPLVQQRGSSRFKRSAFCSWAVRWRGVAESNYWPTIPGCAAGGWSPQIVKEGLTTLRRYASSRDTEAFFATLFRLLQEQLGDRALICRPRLSPRPSSRSICGRAACRTPPWPACRKPFTRVTLARYAPVKNQPGTRIPNPPGGGAA